MSKHIFLSYASRDQNKASDICERLELSGIRCWIAPRDVVAGSDFPVAIVDAIRSSSAVLLLLSPASNGSRTVSNEVHFAYRHEVPVVPIIIEEVELSTEMEYLIGTLRWIDIAKEPWPDCLASIAGTLADRVAQIERSEVPVNRDQEPTTKGYVFISYSRDDRDFVVRLKDVLKRRMYAYWDYCESERDYHSALYKELEEKIENAKAFMCVVTDSWRESEWPAAEYIYAKDAGVPVFVIQAKKLTRPVPIIINQQTRIDMAGDFAAGSAVLEHELDKKRL